MNIYPDIQLPRLDPHPLTLRKILYEVCSEYRVSLSEVRSDSRKAYIVQARKEYCRRSQEIAGKGKQHTIVSVMELINRTPSTFYNSYA